jgi:hypothetical protein
MRRIWLLFTSFSAILYLMVPDLVRAAEGNAEMLVVVADTRRVSSPLTTYFLDLYNTDPLMFGLVCAIITAMLGGGLGLIADFVMKRTGIDLTSRKLVEH